MNVLGHQSLAVSNARSFGLSQQSHRPLHCTKVARSLAWQDCTPLMGGGALPAALTPRGRGSPRGSHPSNTTAHTPGRKVCRLMALHLSVWECPSKAVRDRPCGYYPGAFQRSVCTRVWVERVSSPSGEAHSNRVPVHVWSGSHGHGTNKSLRGRLSATSACPALR